MSIMPISQMKEVRLREVTWLVHKHTARCKQSWASGLRPQQRETG